MAPLSQFHIRILLNGPQDARLRKFRFAYAENRAKQRRYRDVRDNAHNPNELGRIYNLLAGVSLRWGTTRARAHTRCDRRQAHREQRGARAEQQNTSAMAWRLLGQAARFVSPKKSSAVSTTRIPLSTAAVHTARANSAIFKVRDFACFCGSKYVPSM